MGDAVKKRGRPTVYTEEAAREICERLAHGETLNAICKDEHLPNKSAVLNWVLDQSLGFADQYRRARDLQLEWWADATVDIADDGTNDWVEKRAKNGEIQIVLDREHVSRSELRVNTRKWLLSKLKPERYGERVEVHTHKHKPVSAEPAAVTTEKKDSWLDQHGNSTEPTLQ